MKRKSFSLLLVIVCVLCGCSKKQEIPEDNIQVEEEKIQIGMSFDSFVIERWQRDRDVFVSKAKELGAEVNVQNANGDLSEQISQIEYFVKKKMDVIVIICINADGLADVVKKAKDQGIKVICYDRMINGGNADLYISFDNEQVGVMMGKALVEAGIETKKVLMLCGPTTDNNVAMVEKGFSSVMRANNVEIIDVMHAEGWKAEQAGDYIYDNMDVVNQVDAIMCGNDCLATQCIRALAEKRLAGIIKVVGQDADLEGCQRIVEGTQVMTVYKPVEKLAQRAAEYAIKLAKGEDLGELSTISDGVYKVPSVVLEPITVNALNIDNIIINSGYHLYEDVYLNVSR
ncbi:MAG TPA: substrate-binding domain-containing protein [Lachnospiraceae bacterium]|nr:substrate-binding domain-containing protein [Lachnospiraceae bacterium]